MKLSSIAYCHHFFDNFSEYIKKGNKLDQKHPYMGQLSHKKIKACQNIRITSKSFGANLWRRICHRHQARREDEGDRSNHESSIEPREKTSLESPQYPPATQGNKALSHSACCRLKELT
jgi:hypothetical protein